ncbi:MAG: HAMP domain-containing histidine kinase [Chloroflexi bacterium]|uniref:histidine kinase n=1 Tax=Candidatus Chlorohelix allophototropha TaxID=3003348 RepID=A0A8T7M6L2_9CHLR|nr:HAMP domain-containing histidine kinase [Chloroflexota bacterium]WJW69616.1 ATP-binding protein [Chloroflexota bacterium L227-S17]
MNSLRTRLLISYLSIIVVGVFTLFIAASLISSTFFQADIRSILAEKGNNAASIESLNSAFNNGVRNSLIIAAFASLITALVISLVMSSRLSQPLRALGIAATRIASGKYSERVRAPAIKEMSDLAYCFNQMAETLQENESRRRELIADLAHELRTPLTAIEGHMEGLIDGVLEPTPVTFGIVQREARRLHRLSEELSELSRVESGMLKLNLEKQLPLEVLNEVIAKVSPQFEFKGVRLEIDPAAAKASAIKGDRDRIEQVLINLLSNALRYTEKDGYVKLHANNMSDGVEFKVEDNGGGISQEHLKHVFERFYRADKSRSRGASSGSGIGLTIAKYLIQAQGGDIWIESEPGKGTTVHFSLLRWQ